MLNHPLGLLLLVVIVIAVIVLIVKAAQAHAERERQRLAGLSAWADLNGFAFSPDDRWDLDSRYQGVDDIGHGHDRYAYEVLFRDDPAPVAIFEYHYKTWETRTVTERDSRGHTRTRTERYEQDHYRSYLIVELNTTFPTLAIRDESWLDRVAGFMGMDDIDFESSEFSRRYHCKSDDRKFAYAVIHPQMMEWILTQPQFHVSFTGGRILMTRTAGDHTAESCQRDCAKAAGFVNRIPAFVWKDYAQREPIKLIDAQPYVAPVPAEVAH